MQKKINEYINILNNSETFKDAAEEIKNKEKISFEDALGITHATFSYDNKEITYKELKDYISDIL